jgi:hypothetical protein
MDTSHYNPSGNYSGRRYLLLQDVPVIISVKFAMFVKRIKSRKELWIFKKTAYFNSSFCFLHGGIP